MAPFVDKKILLPYQKKWLEDKSPMKIWLAARQTGKSFTLALEAVMEALERKRSTSLILSASERQSREVMEKVLTHLRYFCARSGEIISAEDSREEARLPNGSRIISLPANPDTVRGFSGNVFLDEFAFHTNAEEIWRAMYPAVTRGFGVRGSSTPKGKQNLFHALWDRADGFSRHCTTIHDAINNGLDIDIQRLRAGILDPESWAQEYECRFLDETTAFITYDMIAACEDEGAIKEFSATERQRGSAAEKQSDAPAGFKDCRAAALSNYSTEFYLGMDIARKNDLTVFWLWEKVGDVFWTRMVREMKNAPFAAQRDFLYALMDGSYGFRVRRACLDSSGLGAQLAEEAIQGFGPSVEAVVFTGKVKEDLAVTLRRKLEERQVRIPADRNIREDFHSVRKFVTAAGNIRFDGERTKDGHADRFWAAALGLNAAITPPTGGLIEFEALSRKPRRFAAMGGY